MCRGRGVARSGWMVNKKCDIIEKHKNNLESLSKVKGEGEGEGVYCLQNFTLPY